MIKMPCPKRTHEEIIAALERWLKRLPESEKDKVIIHCACGRHTYTPRQWVQKIKKEDPELKKALKNMAASLQKGDKDIVEWIDNMGKK